MKQSFGSLIFIFINQNLLVRQLVFGYFPVVKAARANGSISHAFEMTKFITFFALKAVAHAFIVNAFITNGALMIVLGCIISHYIIISEELIDFQLLFHLFYSFLMLIFLFIYIGRQIRFCNIIRGGTFFFRRFLFRFQTIIVGFLTKGHPQRSIIEFWHLSICRYLFIMSLFLLILWMCWVLFLIF